MAWNRAAPCSVSEDAGLQRGIQDDSDNVVAVGLKEVDSLTSLEAVTVWTVKDQGLRQDLLDLLFNGVFQSSPESWEARRDLLSEGITLDDSSTRFLGQFSGVCRLTGSWRADHEKRYWVLHEVRKLGVGERHLSWFEGEYELALLDFEGLVTA